MSEDTKMIMEELAKIHGRLDKMDGRLDRMDDRFDKMDGRLDRMDDRFDKMDGRLDRMDDRFDKMDRCMDALESSTKQEIRSLKTYLENEIETKINIVAEGHFDLMRKFRQVQLCNEEWEMMKIRILALERGVREIKAKMQVA
ncbi:hypothetical protein KE530_12485 [Clostridiaceae bacterium Marseille-Q4145]|nr:hypothetical protein [Clostridiaceae bacterium Marseille-Q4145]